MNGILLLIPFLLIRFALLSALNQKAIGRAAYFAPMLGKEKIFYYIYQISNVGIFIYLLFLTVKADFSWKFYAGLVCYLLGLGLSAATMVNFSFPDNTGLNVKGMYQLSRNPMYVAYFVCFLGMVMLTQSLILFGIVCIFQISAHWIILAEERWCLEKFGVTYKQYMKRVRRYI